MVPRIPSQNIFRGIFFLSTLTLMPKSGDLTLQWDMWCMMKHVPSMFENCTCSPAIPITLESPTLKSPALNTPTSFVTLKTFLISCHWKKKSSEHDLIIFSSLIKLKSLICFTEHILLAWATLRSLNHRGWWQKKPTSS